MNCRYFIFAFIVIWSASLFANESMSARPDRIDVIQLNPGQWLYNHRVSEESRKSYYQVEDRPYNIWFPIVETRTLNLADIERFRLLYSALRLVPSKIYGPKWQHGPRFAFRFYAKDRLLYQTSIDWTSNHSIYCTYGNDHSFAHFDPSFPASIVLLEESEKLFNQHQ